MRGNEFAEIRHDWTDPESGQAKVTHYGVNLKQQEQAKVTHDGAMPGHGRVVRLAALKDIPVAIEQWPGRGPAGPY